MQNQGFSSVLICPYPCMEEEALAWAVLLFQQVHGLAPFPLSLPETVQELTARRLFQLRGPQRTEEEIWIKEKFLRDIRSFAAGLPEHGLLQYLNQTQFLKEGETLEEILRNLRGEPDPQALQAPAVLTGSLLICLIHEWLLQEWAIDRSMVRVEELEGLLTRGWQDPLNETTNLTPDTRSKTMAPSSREIPCPLALSAWRILRESLFPEPWPLITTQPWVWFNHYGLDPREEGVTDSIPLPDMGPFSARDWEAWEGQGQGETLRSRLEDLAKPLPESERQKAVRDFQESLNNLGWPPRGGYRLVLPPGPLSSRPATDSVGRQQALFLLVSERG
jgi:hypothetical protein